ncbi:MAG: LAGLIDADG family homing endonuclease, partial [Candidatus Micrarchaeota archaeon]|nr:LAGLIDADG family homing endonuclease [Candidatus Micrarchaeota archaeon]
MAKAVTQIMLDFPSYLRNPGLLRDAARKARFMESHTQRQAAAKKPGVIISTAGMCLHPDTFVQQEDGSCKKIGQVQGPVYSHENGEITVKEVSRILKKPSPKKVLKIRTASGRITCTTDHKFLTLDGFTLAWKAAGELRTGSHVAVAKRIPFQGREQAIPIRIPKKKGRHIKKARLPKKTSPALAQFLGYFIGDGNIKNNKITFLTDKDEENLKHYQKIARSVFGVQGQIQIGSRKRLAIYSSRVARFLKAIEGNKSPHRTIPEFIQKSSQKSVAAFLRGLFDAEGTVSHSTNRSVSAYSSSADIVHVTQLLLLRFGLRSEIRTLKKAANNKQYTWFSLRIHHPQELATFAQKIGFSSKAKRKKLKTLVSNIGGGYSHSDILPLTKAALYARIQTALGAKRIPWAFNKSHEVYGTN